MSEVGPGEEPASHRGNRYRETIHDETQISSLHETQTSPATPVGRIRRHHIRSRAGCSQCKTRKVKCDEKGPICGGCEKRGVADLVQFPHWATASTTTSISPSILDHIRETGTVISNDSLPAAGPSSLRFDHVEQPNHSVGRNRVQSTVFDTSCLSQRPHAGTQTQTTLDPSALSSFSKVSDPRLSLSDSGFALNNHHPNSRADIGTTGSNGANVDWTLNWGQPSVVSAQVTEKDIGNDTLEQVDLDAWMKSNEMDFQSAVELALTNAPHLFPTGQEHFPYLHQLQLMEDPDGLAAFFQTIEQRHQFRHFFHHASHSLLVAPGSLSDNPFLRHFSHLVFGARAEESVAHDAFKYALLALSSIDLGIRLDQPSQPLSENAMYDISNEQRAQAQMLLTACIASNIPHGDHNATDLVLATVVALCIRDRLAGSQDWEDPLGIGQSVLKDLGGPGLCVITQSTPIRRFLVEQLAILDLIASLTYMSSPKIFACDNDWFEWYATDSDHVQDVFGWTRSSVVYFARAMSLFGEARDIDVIRKTQPTPNHKQLSSIISSRSAMLVERVKVLIPRGETLRLDIQSLSLRSEVIAGALVATTCLELFIRTCILAENIGTQVVQKLVESILDIAESSITRGAYAGMLMPLNMIDGMAHNSHYTGRIKDLLSRLRGRYHMRAQALEKIIDMDWTRLIQVRLAELDSHLRNTGYFVLLF